MKILFEYQRGKGAKGLCAGDEFRDADDRLVGSGSIFGTWDWLGGLRLRGSIAGHRPAVRGRGQRGSALLVVFILLTLMVMLTLANALALHHLRQEMRLIEKRQLKKFVVPAKSPVEKPVRVEPTARPDP